MEISKWDPLSIDDSHTCVGLTMIYPVSTGREQTGYPIDGGLNEVQMERLLKKTKAN
jgi:hypothetical protein